MGWGISFPLDEVLLLFAICPSVKDLFNLPFWFTFYKVWWGFQEVWAMGRCLIVGGQERCMEYIVDFPVVGEFESAFEIQRKV
jgi:hypothetical protein